MKLRQWLFGATALAMLAACSDKDIAPGSGGENGGSNPEEVGSGYLAVQINLPQDAGTRAVQAGGNDNFNDGTANEYKVDNAMIIIFKGKDEKSANFCKAQDLKRPWFTNKPSNDQITSSYLAAVKVNDLSQTDIDNGVTYWGLVILNRNEDTTDISTSEDADVLENTEEVTLGGTKITSANNFQDVLDIITENKFLKVSGSGNNASYSKFFMTNAPLATLGGGGVLNNTIGTGNIQCLVDLGSKTYETIEDARANVKNCIYVERAVAKVTCADAGNYELKLVGVDGELDADDYKVKATVEYALTNTNRKSYLVRNVNFPDKHFNWNYVWNSYKRMVGELSMPGLGEPYHGDVDKYTNFYRTYWCYDPNYGGEMEDDEDGTTEKYIFDPENNPTTDVFVSLDKPLYCKENTFDVKHQSYFNTTMAVFKVDFNIVENDDNEQRIGDGNLYIKNEDNSVIYVDAVAAASQEISRIKNDTNIAKALEEAAKASGVTGTITDATQYLDIKFEQEEGKDYLLCKSITLKAGGGFTAAGVAKFSEVMNKDDVMADLIDSVNRMNDITIYKGGVSYYLQPIMHFGKVHCPFLPLDDAGNEVYSGTTTKDVYNGGAEFDEGDTDAAVEHAKRFLGRYGMVRNNWYELSINKITALGSTKVPDIDVNLSDDNNEVKKYIGVEIHILSWAKRTQNVDF